MLPLELSPELPDSTAKVEPLPEPEEDELPVLEPLRLELSEPEVDLDPLSMLEIVVSLARELLWCVLTTVISKSMPSGKSTIMLSGGLSWLSVRASAHPLRTLPRMVSRSVASLVWGIKSISIPPG